jgi:hypothetical protein
VQYQAIFGFSNFEKGSIAFFPLPLENLSIFIRLN